MKTIYLITLYDPSTKREDVLFAVDGSRDKSKERMMEYANANKIDPSLTLFLKPINCYIK
jgi:hypothetical protein